MDKKHLYMLFGDLSLLLVAFLWGTVNVVLRNALGGITPFWFCVLRFLVASATVFIIFGKKAFAMTRRDRITGLIIGTVFIGAYLTGAAALLYTTAGNESFIISTSVVFVPLIMWIFTRKFPGWHVMAAVLLCMAGMTALMTDSSLTFNKGDMLCFVSMLFVSAHMILIQKYVQDTNPYGLSCWQSLGGLLLALAAAAGCEPMPAHLSAATWAAITFAGTIGFAFTLIVQTTAQKYTTATHAAILLATAGVFGRLLGIIFLGEPATFRIFAASGLILAGIIFMETAPLLMNRRAGRRA